MENTIYQIKGYKNRLTYLYSLAYDFDIDIELVYQCAEMLGEYEDFDGLVSILQDYEQW